MQKGVALILVIIGAVLLLKTLAATWLVLLLLAAAFAWGASSGSVGRWGYTAAAVCAVLAIPGLFLRTIFRGIALALGMFKFFPVLLVILGIYLLFKPSRRR